MGVIPGIGDAGIHLVFGPFSAGDLNVPNDQISARGSRAQGSAGACRGGGDAVPGGRRERARRAAQAGTADPPGRERGDANRPLPHVEALDRARADRPLPRLQESPGDRPHVRGPVRGDRTAMRDELRLLGPRRRRRRPPLSAGRPLGADGRLRAARHRGAVRSVGPRPVGAVGDRARPHMAAVDRQRARIRLPRLARRRPRSRGRPRPASRWAGSPAVRRTGSPSWPTTPPGTSRCRRRSTRPRRRAPHRRPATASPSGPATTSRRSRRRSPPPRCSASRRGPTACEGRSAPATASSSSGRAPASSSPEASSSRASPIRGASGPRRGRPRLPRMPRAMDSAGTCIRRRRMPTT